MKRNRKQTDAPPLKNAKKVAIPIGAKLVKAPLSRMVGIGGSPGSANLLEEIEELEEQVKAKASSGSLSTVEVLTLKANLLNTKAMVVMYHLVHAKLINIGAMSEYSANKK